MPNKTWSLLAALLTAIWVGPAHASLKFCNKAGEPYSFAVAYKVEEGWQVKGWWNIDPGDCKIAVGGKLKNRFYYWRAHTKDGHFSGEEYFFCTKPKAFSIVGEQGNCALRGLDSHEFSVIDTGKTATDYTHNFVPPKGKSDEPAAKAEDQEPAVSGGAGTYGERFSTDAIFQECLQEGDAKYCAFHADGTKFFVYDDGRTPAKVLSFLRQLLPGDPIHVEGDLVEVFDATAEVALRGAAGRKGGAHESLLNMMQGYWVSAVNPKTRFNILGAERINDYDGQPMGTEYLSISATCGDFSDGGPYLSARDPEIGDTLCYTIERVDELTLRLMYLPRGTFLQYRKLD